MKVDVIKNKVEQEIKNKIKNYLFESNLIQNINYNCIDNQSKCLICYITKGFFQNLEDNISHTQSFEIHKIVKVFSEFGYTIDIIDSLELNAINKIDNNNYDLIFGFGEVFYQMIHLNPKAFSIYYMTENHPEYSYKAEKQRIDYYYERHHKKLNIVRSGRFYKSLHLTKKYNRLITLGEIEPFKSQYDKIYSIFPTGIINPEFVFSNKNHEQTRTHFLWFGTTAVIHKGLDLLVDVFSKREDVVLHICGITKKASDLLKIPKKANIIQYGKIDVKGDIFLKLVEICSFTIFPSCSEGFATSITTCMLHGLIPIVNRNTGFNRLRHNALFFDDFKVEYINDKVTEFSKYNPEALKLFSKSVYDFARQNFLITEFEINFKNIITEIIQNND